MAKHPAYVKIEQETLITSFLQHLLDSGYVVCLRNNLTDTSEPIHFLPHLFQVIRERLGDASCNFECDDIIYPVTIEIKTSANHAPLSMLYLQGAYDEQMQFFKFVMSHDESYQSALRSFNVNIVRAFKKYFGE